MPRCRPTSPRCPQGCFKWNEPLRLRHSWDQLRRPEPHRTQQHHQSPQHQYPTPSVPSGPGLKAEEVELIVQITIAALAPPQLGHLGTSESACPIGRIVRRPGITATVGTTPIHTTVPIPLVPHPQNSQTAQVRALEVAPAGTPGSSVTSESPNGGSTCRFAALHPLDGSCSKRPP